MVPPPAARVLTRPHLQAFGVTTPDAFNALAQSITAVGEAALLGALGQFQWPQDYLPLIGPILGVEARQNTVFRIFERQTERFPSEAYNGAPSCASSPARR